MEGYHNVMEDVLEQEFDDTKDTLGCCTCDQCRNDIIAFALNQVNPRYVVTKSGNLMSKVDSLRSQALTDVRAALMRGAMLVTEKPRH